MSVDVVRVKKLVKAGKSFAEIAKTLKISIAKLYRAMPGGARVVEGKPAYMPRTSFAKKRKKPAEKAAPLRTPKASKKAKAKSEW